MCDDTDWQSDAEDKKKLKRDAADRFLAATLDDANLRESVLASPSAAREAFQTIGEMTLPEDVEVICVAPDRIARNKLVVFVLPKTPGTELWRECWVAAWQPY